MEYVAGQIKRVFMIRFDHGDDLLGSLKDMVRKEGIQCGWIQILGGMRKAKIVTGPEKPEMPPVPVWNEVENAKELIATGSILWSEDEPVIHMHGAMGDSEETLVGCLRKDVETYLLLEAVLIELSDMHATRQWYPEGEFYRMTFPMR